MADDFDVDAMLEAAYQSKSGGGGGSLDGRGSNDEVSPRANGDRGDRKKSRRSRSRSRSRDKDRGDRRRRSGSRDRDRDRKRSRKSRSRSRDRRRRSRSRDRENGGRRSGGDRRRRSRSKDKSPRRSNKKSRSKSPQREERERDDNLTPEERDARTVFCMQLSQRVRARDLEDFFSSVGKVRDVRLITCNKTRRFKGIAYVEFKDISSVALAIGLNGQKVLGIPIIVQPSQAEKNRQGQNSRAGAMAAMMATAAPGPMKLYVGSLHFNITEEMLRGIFEPFGRIDEIQLMKDHETGRSKGFGFITFHEGEDAKRAMEQLNGFEIAGRPMKVGYVTDKSDSTYYANPQSLLDSDEMDRAGVNLGVTGRLQLMAKLAEGTDLKLPEAAANALQMQAQPAHPTVPAAPPIATQCFMLSNMFDPAAETENPGLEQEIRDDVLEACLDHGGVVHIYVDTKSPDGCVYCKCPTVAAAVAAVNTFHGRWFAARLVTAAYVPLLNYHNLFPDAMAAQVILRPGTK